MDMTTTLGRSDLRVPRLGVGAMTWGDPTGLARLNPAKLAYGGAHGFEEEKRAFEASVAAGANLFDTAAMYSSGAAEQRLGELARDKAVLIATNSKAIPQLMELMADAVGAGKVRAVGVSNYSAEQMQIAHAALAQRGIPLASNQVEYSLLHRQPEVNGVLDACRELGVTLIAYSPLAMGALTGKYSATTKPSGFRRFLPTFNKKTLDALQPVVQLLRQIGNRYAKSSSQIALRWLIENPLVLPIPGAKNGKQAIENAGALSFSLTSEEVETLNQVTLAWRA